MNNGSDNISGFIEGTPMQEGLKFTHLEEIYASKDSYTRLLRCERLGKLHILKALQPNYIGRDFYEQALHKEFSIGFTLDHPHICRTLSWEQIEGIGHCIVMEYIDGETLQSLMDSGRLTPVLAEKIITELCSALDYLHKKQIVHRDLKPSNILITHNGDNVKLTDFSLADADDQLLLKYPAGTRRYLAPEVLEDAPLDCRADIYSLGIIMGEMATLIDSKKLAAVSRLCTKRNREHRPSQALEVTRALHQRQFPWPLLWGMLAALILCILTFLGWKHGFAPQDSPLIYEPDSLSFGHIELGK